MRLPKSSVRCQLFFKRLLLENTSFFTTGTVRFAENSPRTSKCSLEEGLSLRLTSKNREFSSGFRACLMMLA